jgi:hypothetical protein
MQVQPSDHSCPHRNLVEDAKKNKPVNKKVFQGRGLEKNVSNVSGTESKLF